MQLGIVFFGPVHGVHKGGIGMFGKISANKNIFIFGHMLYCADIFIEAISNPPEADWLNLEARLRFPA
jgi:hypothetical protein